MVVILFSRSNLWRSGMRIWMAWSVSFWKEGNLSGFLKKRLVIKIECCPNFSNEKAAYNTSPHQTPPFTPYHRTPSPTPPHRTPPLTPLHQTLLLTLSHRTLPLTPLHQTPCHRTPPLTPLHQTPSLTPCHQTPPLPTCRPAFKPGGHYANLTRG